jgi:hypothetical protein
MKCLVIATVLAPTVSLTQAAPKTNPSPVVTTVPVAAAKVVGPWKKEVVAKYR